MTTTPFRWPPQTPPTQTTNQRPAPSPPAKTPHRSKLWRELAELWLAPTAPPISVRIEETGWKPDAPGTWCDRCAATVGPYEENEFGCANCRGKRLPYDRAVRLGPFTGDLRDWIHEVKFTRFRTLGTDLGKLLARQLTQAGVPENTIICPMPMSRRHRIARGIDHTAAIARGTATELGCPTAQLLRRQHRPSQLSLPASARRRNVAKAFSLTRNTQNLTGKHVILVDDVITTGSTALAAARTLRHSIPKAHRPASLWLAVLATAPQPGTPDSDSPQPATREAITNIQEKK